MLEKFEQKNLFGKRTVELHATEVIVRVKHMVVGRIEKIIPLAEISHRIEIRQINYTERGCLVVGVTYVLVFLFLAPLITQNLFYGTIFIFLYLLFLIAANKAMGDQYLEIKSRHEPILIHINRWTAERGRKFMEQVIEQSRTYLREQYMFLDKDLSFERQVENYRWLLMNELITAEEYESLKRKLKTIKGMRLN